MVSQLNPKNELKKKLWQCCSSRFIWITIPVTNKSGAWHHRSLKLAWSWRIWTKYKVVFCMWFDNHRSFMFILSFKMGVARHALWHAQSFSKQGFRYLTGMSGGMKLFVFCMWGYTHRYIYLIQSIHMGVVESTPGHVKSNSQYRFSNMERLN